MPSAATLPRVAVLLATHNGRRWLPQQLASILGQTGVSVRVVAMDDASTDGTSEWLAEHAALDPRLTVIPDGPGGGGAAANFARIIRQADLHDGELVALSDQDDVWVPGKLERHSKLLRDHGVDGVSSNVTSFSPDGRRRLIRKSFPQRRFDYLLESPGPGSTFLMTPRLVAVVRDVLANQPLAASVDYHDWLIYAVARASGLQWHIDSASTVDYRQHDDNAMGANIGARPALSRLALIRRHWHREQATLLARIGMSVAGASVHESLEHVLGLLERGGSRLQLAGLAGELRRRPRDQRIIALLIILGIW